ncbi:MAG TPA: bacillithiol biosynthesis cysteine-adding enzyme BshC [Candidatus Hydrogenedentes bacterium]|nr:bacillithiol biosynthesis cysteine-adding enzyme BshC [Candidatus Hydrogenedentota bacterium]HRK34656.1 bacillithiol biosynthesis cysteine-adding enzyme BshC [Candidatus Hydrogenedentota bacterium]
MKSIYSAYVEDAQDLAPFYSGSPRSLLSSVPAVGPLYPGLAESLTVYQGALGGSARAPVGDVSVIVTGQQPALFTGPLYTIYKAATAIRLAARLSKASGTPCVPVFWLASDDHDFEEARTAYALTKQHAPMAFTYSPERDVTSRAMYRVPVESSLHAMVDALAEAVPGSEFKDDVRAFLHSSLDEATSFSDWTARLLARLFRDTPLLFFTTELPVMRAASVDILAREIAEPLWSSTRVNESGARLQSLGYETQLAKGATDCGFFLDIEGKRCKVVYEQRDFVVPATGWRYTADELQHMLVAEPERFSPNAALRTVVQQRLFPAVAYVGGPGEVAYWGQFKALFDDLQMRMPVVYPRAQGRITTAKLNKLLHRCGVQVDELLAPIEQIEERALRNAAAGPGMDALANCRREIERCLAELERKLSDAKAPSLGVRERVITELDKAQRALERSDATRVETVKQNVARICNTFAPGRKPQERVYTVFSYLFEHGWGLVPRLTEAIDIESFATSEIEL